MTQSSVHQQQQQRQHQQQQKQHDLEGQGYAGINAETADECTPLKLAASPPYAARCASGGHSSDLLLKEDRHHDHFHQRYNSEEQEEEKQITLTSHPILWVQTLSHNYSWKLLAMVVCTNHLLKGFVAGGGDDGLIGKPVEFLLGELGVAAGRLQMFKAAAAAPWALKPVLALLSDACPIFGYRKMPYVVITTCAAFVAAVLVGLRFAIGVGSIVTCMFIMFLQVSTVDLLVEAKQSEEVKQKAHLGPQFFTFTWLGINVGQVAGVVCLGPIIYHFGPRVPFLIAAPLIMLVLWPTIANFLNERPAPVEERGFNARLLWRHPTLCAITLLIGLLVMALLVSTFFLADRNLLIVAIAVCIVVPSTFMFFIRPEIAGPIVFYFLLGMLSFSTEGALFYFYTDSALNFPHGPHFTALFYTTGLGAATFIGVTVGFISGAELFKNWSYRAILRVTIVLRAFTQLALVPVLTRLTHSLGVPDSLWVLFIMTCDSAVFAWRWIPKQVMGAHLTPQGMEATMLGLIAGTFNMAMILNSYFGGFVLDYLGVKPTGTKADAEMFDELWKVQVIAALAPCAMLFFLPALIPNKVQTEALISQRPDSATYGSLFYRILRPLFPSN
mmetsp:Transcript_19340/g.41685  ORF Transcript_19340/g.41685 Transcript_19340/m.41685 type:complete len:614 (+) Transcript_19340:244-2085(+)|eukprot:CAMPEP_0206490796 /NCGR_PEP_ID=MMETSP0324_2-20121206/44415_1 /ASSEMBLY_ACC=CAM_ASM_000836 /TAXON_ID=2866 /ORGANISM="Crypthecodinium cohnii, Strain Seligo" /LENGTH=613 /DNA_ID=CAMNT_0053971467 /DNA_START=180 /DNA_END=2021 /DNA_ORIENTATION=-